MNELLLIVDDAKFARNMVKRALLNGGYENYIEAASAAEAIELFTEREPDLTLLDITLTDSSDLSLLKRLLEIRPQAKIVMNSAIGQELIINDALKLGARDFITKPFSETDLLDIVKTVLESE